MTEANITARELVSCGMCARGQKRWFEMHGLDFAAHLLNGTPIEVLINTGDGLALKAIEKVREHRGN